MLKGLGPRARIDLHLHTNRSDGAFDPEVVLAKCAAGGLDLVAITDHDLSTSIPSGVHHLGGQRLRVLAGAEMSGEHAGRELHLLVYFPGEVPAAFEALCRAQCQQRAERYAIAVERLQLAGLPPVDAAALAGDRALTRLHLARAMVANGHATHIGDAFSRYLGEAHGHVPGFGFALVDAIRVARAVGGITSWAHPSVADAKAHLPALVAAGLQGIEAYRPALSASDRGQLKRLARAHGIFLTGGSDWHGWNGDDPGLFALSADALGDFADALQAA